MKKTIILLLVSITALTFATDIKLKNGTIITNIEITKETDTYVEFMVEKAKKRIAKIDIEKIRISPVNKSRPARTLDEFETTEPQIVTGHYKPTYLLPAAALSLFVGWDYFAQASDLQDLMDDFGETDELKSQKTRKTLIGAGALIASAALVYFSFQDINIYAAPNKLQVSYKLDL